MPVSNPTATFCRRYRIDPVNIEPLRVLRLAFDISAYEVLGPAAVVSVVAIGWPDSVRFRVNELLKASYEQLPSELDRIEIIIESPHPAAPGGRIDIDVELGQVSVGVEPGQDRSSPTRLMRRVLGVLPMPLSNRATFELPGVPPSGNFSGKFVDNYQLDEKLGEGQSGEVWRATVARLPPGLQSVDQADIVALKLYRPDRVGDVAVARMFREFEASSRARHPSLVRAIDLVIAPARGLYLLAMEHVAGRTIKALRRETALGSVAICCIGYQLIEAATVLRGMNIVHRDIKPANIIVRANSEPLDVVLLDLGIVHPVDATDLTEISTFMGSKHTAAPEYLQGKSVDYRADLYSIGATLYYCYTGRDMYADVGHNAAILARMLERPERLTLPEGGTPVEAELVEIINGLIERDVDKRVSDATACIERLRRLAAG